MRLSGKCPIVLLNPGSALASPAGDGVVDELRGGVGLPGGDCSKGSSWDALTSVRSSGYSFLHFIGSSRRHPPTRRYSQLKVMKCTSQQRLGRRERGLNDATKAAWHPVGLKRPGMLGRRAPNNTRSGALRAVRWTKWTRSSLIFTVTEPAGQDRLADPRSRPGDACRSELPGIRVSLHKSCRRACCEP